MYRTRLRYTLIAIFCSLYVSSFAQKSFPDSLSAFFTTEAIQLDGKLTEQVWQQAQHIRNFTQREPIVGQPATEKTEIALVYTTTTLYIGVWCYDTTPAKIRAKYLSRDFVYNNDDNIRIALDTYRDKKNGYLFVINPNGARYDALISNNGDIINPDWNGVWDAHTEINSQGWFAEIEIPFSTIRYRNMGEQTWGINFERNIRRKLEQDVWQGYSRNYQVEELSVAGTLIDIRDIKGAVHWEFKPYLLGGAQKLEGSPASLVKNIGIDVNKNLLNTLRLNLTVNTDFAQVEADRVQVNLTRFSISYPEKRDFFNEGSGNFQYYLGEGNQGFYSRQIGISGFTRLPIIGGTRLFGKYNRTDIGVFSIQTKQQDSIPSTNYSMIRLKQNVGAQSYVGMIAQSKYSKLGSNQMYGVDGQYVNSHIFRDKNIVIGGHLNMTHTDSLPDHRNLAYRIFVDFPNDLIDNFIGFVGIQQHFNPEMGFLQRKNFKEFSWALRLAPRWFEKEGIRRMNFKPWDLALYTNDTTGRLESYYNEIRPLGFTTKSGDIFEFNLQQSFDRPGNDFNLTDSVIIKAGEYYMHGFEFQLISYPGRKLFGSIIFNRSTFYGGHKQTITSEAGISLDKHFSLIADYINNHVALPQATFTTHELSGNLLYAVNTKWDNSLFAQWNSEINLILFNFRLHIIPKIGSDFYLVFTQGFNRDLKWVNSNQTTGVAKLVYRIAI